MAATEGERDAGTTRSGPRVSVVVVVYNDAERLPNAISSALDQSVSDVEVIICDDGSTDGTEGVARGLCAVDERVQYIRLPRNTGSGSAPRNAGLASVRADWVTFVDSDDELAPNALRLLVEEADRTGADVVTGKVSRLHLDGDRWSGWQVRLFDERKVLESLADEPDRLRDTVAVGKLYKVSFLQREGLRFEPGMLYEDVLWTAQVFTTARRIAVIPEMVYVWKVYDDGPRPSVTNDRRSVRNVRDRLVVNALIDQWLRSSGWSDLLPVKNLRFMRHDLPLYMGDLLTADDEWGRFLLEEFGAYVEQILPSVLPELTQLERLGAWMISQGDVAGARTVFRAITRDEFATDLVVRNGRTYWSGRLLDADPGLERALDVSGLNLDRRPFLQLNVAHELRAWRTTAGGLLSLVTRTWNPLCVVPDGAHLSIELMQRGSGVGARFPGRISCSGPSWFEATFDVDPRQLTRALEVTGRSYDLSLVVRVGKLENTGTIPFPRPPDDALDTLRWAVGLGRTALLNPGPTAQGHLGLRMPDPRDSVSGGLTVGPSRSSTAWPGGPGGSARRMADAVTKRVRRAAVKPLAVFCAESGLGYSGNPKALHEQIQETEWSGEAVWVRGPGGNGFPADIETVQLGSRGFYLATGSASHWIDDGSFPDHVRKPRGTIYLRTGDRQSMQARMAEDDNEVVLLDGRQADCRWDFLLDAQTETKAMRARAARSVTRVSGGLGTPFLDPLVRHGAVPKRASDEREVGLPSDREEGLNVLLGPLRSPRPRTAGLPWSVEDAARLIGGTGRLLISPLPGDRWLIPGHQSHLLVDVGRVPDWGRAMLASDVLVVESPELSLDYVLLDRPIVMFRPPGFGNEHAQMGLSVGPVARSDDELIDLLASVHDWDDGYRAARGELRARHFAAEDGHASARALAAVFGGG